MGIPTAAADAAAAALRHAFAAELTRQEIDAIEVRPDLATIAVVGLGMAGKSNQAARGDMAMEDDVVIAAVLERPRPLAPRLSQIEEQAHEALVAKLGEKSVWAKYANLD